MWAALRRAFGLGGPKKGLFFFFLCSSVHHGADTSVFEIFEIAVLDFGSTPSARVVRQPLSTGQNVVNQPISPRSAGGPAGAAGAAGAAGSWSIHVGFLKVVSGMSCKTKLANPFKINPTPFQLGVSCQTNQVEIYGSIRCYHPIDTLPTNHPLKHHNLTRSLPGLTCSK